MKKLIYAISLVLLGLTYSCSDDDSIDLGPIPSVTIENLTDVTSTAQSDTITLKAQISSQSKSEFVWAVNGKVIEGATDSVFLFTQKDLGEYTVSLTCTNVVGESSAVAKFMVYGKFKYGTFILNEGNMTTENGSLIFISPKGVVTDSVYSKMNGTELGNVTQDLSIVNNKMYIISQNGKTNAVGNGFDNDGVLVVANAETMKKIQSYNEELSTLSWPTHVAVLDDNNIFIRDNKGVYSFDSTTKKLKLITGTSGALKNRMAVVKDKVFVPASKSVLVLNKNEDEVSHKIDMGAIVSGVIKTNDGNIYVSTTGTPNKITKINANDYSVIQENTISEGKVGAGWGATPGISAKGDTIYFSNASTKIYRHIFSTSTTELMVDAKTMVENANIVYNNLAVHPLTGEVYLNTIKAYGWDFLINNISVFNFGKKEPQLSANYKNHTHFPAGIFFTYDFE